MNILCFAPDTGYSGTTILDMLKIKFPLARFIRYSRLTDFGEKLRQPIQTKTAALVLSTREADFLNLYQLYHLFYRMPVIMAIPDNENDTAALSRRFNPAFACHQGHLFEEVSQAISAIASNTYLWKSFGEHRNHLTMKGPHKPRHPSIRYFPETKAA